MLRFKLRRRIKSRVCVLKRLIGRLWDRILMCSKGKPKIYQMLPRNNVAPCPSPQPPVSAACGSEYKSGMAVRQSHDNDSDLVDLKVSLLGDGQIGKTSFLVKYVGNESDNPRVEQAKGLNVMDKTFFVSGARISYNIWEVEGNGYNNDHIPLACKDSVAILIMFDLTSRCTMNSILRWFHRARIYNQKAIPILVGTKFDDFIQLPIDLQWTIASEARAYAKALKATLFFSSATYNINVNKIFKFITAKLFDLPWTVERNLTIGEPIIDF